MKYSVAVNGKSSGIDPRCMPAGAYAVVIGGPHDGDVIRRPYCGNQGWLILGYPMVARSGEQEPPSSVNLVRVLRPGESFTVTIG